MKNQKQKRVFGDVLNNWKQKGNPMISLMRKRTDKFIISVLKEPKNLSLWHQMRLLNLMSDDFLKLTGGREKTKPNCNCWHSYGGNVLNAPLRQCAKLRHLTDSKTPVQTSGDIEYIHEKGGRNEPEAWYVRCKNSPLWLVLMNDELLFEHQQEVRYMVNLNLPPLYGNKAHLSISVNGNMGINDVKDLVQSIQDNLKSFKRRKGVWCYSKGLWYKKEIIRDSHKTPTVLTHPVLDFLAKNPDISRYEQFLFFCLSQRPDFIPPLNHDKWLMDKLTKRFQTI